MRLERWRAYLRVIGLAAEMAFRSNLSDAFVLFGILVQPMLIAMLAFWMLRERGSDYIIFVVVGSGMTGLWTSLLFTSGNRITEERWTGTLELVVGAPTPIQLIVFGKILADTVQSLSSMVLSYILAILVFGQLPSIDQPLFFATTIIIAVISYVCFGLIISPVFILNPDVQRLQNGLEFPVYILCGFLFPIALLPGWTTPFSYILAPYWAALALHGTSGGGASVQQILLCWLMMAVLSIIYFIVSRYLFRRLLRKARTDATLMGQ